MTEEEMRAWILATSYAKLLEKWRFESSGSPWFHGAIGEFYESTMNEKKAALAPGEAARISKEIG